MKTLKNKIFIPFLLPMCLMATVMGERFDSTKNELNFNNHQTLTGNQVNQTQINNQTSYQHVGSASLSSSNLEIYSEQNVFFVICLSLLFLTYFILRHQAYKPYYFVFQVVSYFSLFLSLASFRKYNALLKSYKSLHFVQFYSLSFGLTKTSQH